MTVLYYACCRHCFIASDETECSDKRANDGKGHLIGCPFDCDEGKQVVLIEEDEG